MTEPTPISLPFIHLVYGVPDLQVPDMQTLAERIQRNEPGRDISDIQISWQRMDAQQCLGVITFGLHQIQIAGLSNPLPPDIINRTVHTSHWQPQIKAAIRQHQSHISLVYTGKSLDPAEKMTALYQAAHALENENLLGVVNESAWTAHPRADFLSLEKIQQYRQEIPFILWVGYIKFFIDRNRFWLVTKGHHIFDVPDLAYLVQPGDSTDDVTSMFINVFYYLYEGDTVVTAGDTLSIGKTGEHMRFSEVTEYPEILLGPSGTLVIEKISPEET